MLCVAEFFMMSLRIEEDLANDDVNVAGKVCVVFCTEVRYNRSDTAYVKSTFNKLFTVFVSRLKFSL